jgi:4-hydroxy-tetrahydrodipicolinate synthase
VRHYEEVAKATHRPILLYNIPGRCVVNIGPEMLARLAQIEHIDGVKQANPDELQLIDGLDLYAGDDELLFARALEIGGAGGVCVASHVIGDVMRQMVEEPARRAELEEIVQDVHRTLFMTASPTCTKAALNMLGHKVGGLRLPLIEADEHELSAVRAMLVRHGLLSEDAGVASGTATDSSRRGADSGGRAAAGARATGA